MFGDGDEVHLQCRNGKPLDALLPRGRARSPTARYVLDGEIVIVDGSVQEFDLLSQRIHPAASRIERLREETPARLVAFDLLAERRRGRCSSCPTTSAASARRRVAEPGRADAGGRHEPHEAGRAGCRPPRA